MRETLRPDISGVLVQMHQKASAATGPGRMGIIVTLLNRAALKAEGLAETVAAADLPLTLQIPGPPGHTYGQAQVNDALLGPIRARNKAGVLEVLRRARAIGCHGDHKPIVLRPRPALSPSPSRRGPG